MVIYNSGDSDQLINSMTSNLQTAKEVFSRLDKGSRHLDSVIDSGTLSGAAYKAGQIMFQTYIFPMIKQLNSAIDDIQNDLTSYKAADSQIKSVSNRIDEAHVKAMLANTNQLIALVEQKMRDDKDLIKSFTEKGLSGAITGLSELPGLEGQLDNLKSLKHDYEKQLEAIQTFSFSTNSLFTDSLEAFKYALQGVEIINQSKASVDGTITFPAGADMSWSSKLQGEKFSSSLSKKKPKPDKIEVKWTPMNGNGEVYPMIYVNGKLDKKKTSDARWAMTKIGWENLKKLAPDVFAELVGINDIKTLLDPKSSLAQNGISFFSLLLTYFPPTKAVKIVKAMDAAKALKAGGEAVVDLNKISKAAGLTEKEAKAFEELWKSEKIITKAKIGDDFGKVGIYVEHPNVSVDWKQSATHASERMSERGMSEEQVNDIVKNGKALSQNGGAKYLFVTKDGAAVVSKDGKMVTAWSKNYFDDSMNDIIKKLYGE